MPCSVLDFKDVVVVPMGDPDDARLRKVHKKGFVAEMRSLSAEELDEWVALYPVWYLRAYRRMPVLWCPDKKKVRVMVPNLRSHRAGYYAWFKYVLLPDGGYWYLLTLTLFRSVPMHQAWASINRWVSRALNRFRTYLKTKYRAEISYIWVVESHKDGYCHVHVLFRMPYIHELNFRKLLSMFQSYWVDDEGRPLCAPNGVDLKCIGRNVQFVREYVLKYLVKQHKQYWGFRLLPDGRVAFRRSTGYIWLFKVRLFGMSQDIRAKVREYLKSRRGDKSVCGWKWYGVVSANRLHKLFYKPLGIPFESWIEVLPERGYMEYPDRHLPELVPSAFSSRGSPVDDEYSEVIEHF